MNVCQLDSYVVVLFLLYDSRSCGHVFRHPYISAYHGILADGDAPQDSGVGVDYHVVLQDRVARNALDRIAVGIERKALRSERHTLIQFHVVANDARFANHHSCAVVNSEVSAYLCPWVDVNSCFRMRHLSKDSRNERHAQLVQLMGYAVVDESLDYGVATDDFAVVLCRRVAVVGSLHVSGKHASEFGQAANERRCYFFAVNIAVAVLRIESHSRLNLFSQKRVQTLHAHADVKLQSAGVDRRIAVVARENN